MITSTGTLVKKRSARGTLVVYENRVRNFTWVVGWRSHDGDEITLEEVGEGPSQLFRNKMSSVGREESGIDGH